MSLSDKINQIREIGIVESDTNIQHLLSKCGYSVERAIAQYFEHGLSNEPATIANPFASHVDRHSKALTGAKPVAASSVKVIKSVVTPWSSTSSLTAQSKATCVNSSSMLATNNSLLSNTTSISTQLNSKFPRAKSIANPFSSSSQSKSSSQHTSLQNCRYTCFNFIGRRHVTGYSLSSGYVVRTQSLQFTVETDTTAAASTTSKENNIIINSKQSNNVINRSGSTNNTITGSKKPYVNSGISGSNSKDKFSAGKLFFDTYHDTYSSNAAAASSDSLLQKNVRGRLSNNLCDFLVPLLRLQLIELRGHIAYDYGAIGTFQDLPLSLHIYVSTKFFELTSSTATATESIQTSASSSSLNDLSTTDATAAKRSSISSSVYGRDVVEAANDLLIWLVEGETAVTLLRQQRAKEVALKRTLENATSSGGINGEPTISVDVVKVEGSQVPPRNNTVARNDTSFIESSVCIEGESDDGATENTMCVDEFLTHETVLNSMPQAVTPGALVPQLTMKTYQLQALHWMQQREEVTLTTARNISFNTASSSGVDENSDCEVVICEPAIKSLLFLPHEGVVRFPESWGAVEREANPLWMPIVSYHNSNSNRNSNSNSNSNSGESSVSADNGESPPQLIHSAIASYSCSDLSTSSVMPIRDDTVTVFWWNRYSQRIQLTAPLAPRPCRGGILAHEMGMGKTIMMIALIASDEAIAKKILDVPEEESALVVTEAGMSSDDSLNTSSHSKVTPEVDVVDCGGSSPVIVVPRRTRGRSCQIDDDDSSELTMMPLRSSNRTLQTVTDTTLTGHRRSVDDDYVLDIISSSDHEGGEEEESDAEPKAIKENTRGNKRKNDRSLLNAKRQKTVTTRTSCVIDLLDSESNDEKDEVSMTVSFPAASRVMTKQTTNTSSYSSSASRLSPPGSNNHSGTLIVCPMTLMNQWVEEIRRKTKKGSLSVFMYYGTERQTDMLVRHDVVVTSYGMLVSEAKSIAAQQEKLKSRGSTLFKSSNKTNAIITGLLDIAWHRVVLDEAHTIKNSLTEVARACYSVTAQCRWALTGTPIQNSLDDLHSLVRFLHHEPWDQVRWWRKVITEPHATGDPRGIVVLRGVLAELMLRRTKLDKDNSGKNIVELPGKTCHVVKVDLSDAEREFYSTLMNRSRAVCRGYEAELNGMKRKNRYAALFTLLLRLRQTCDHAFLVIGKNNNDDSEEIILTTGNDTKKSNVEAFVTDDVTNAVVSIDADDTESPVLGPAFLKSVYAKLAHSMRSSSASSTGNSHPVDDVTIENSTSMSRHHHSDSSYLLEVMRNLQDISSMSAATSSTTADVVVDDNRTIECPICYEDRTVLDTCVTNCGHILCLLCAQASVKLNASCPLCMTSLRLDDIIPLSGRELSAHISETDASTANKSVSTRRNYAIQLAFAKAVHNQEQRAAPTAVSSSSSSSSGQSGAEILESLPMNPLVAMMNRSEGQAGAWRHWGDKRSGSADKTSSLGNDGNCDLQYEGLHWHSSSKLTALMNMLDSIFSGRAVALNTSTDNETQANGLIVNEVGTCSKRSETAVKVVIFSQWTSMLDLIEFAFNNDINRIEQQSSANSSTTTKNSARTKGSTRYAYRRLDGSMSQTARAAAVNSFTHDDSVQIFLISLKAGGVGLNLTSASVVILVDPWWNPSTEDQAIDRIHRLGQTREVTVYRLICRDTVEERLLQLQDKKRSLSQKAIGREGLHTDEAKLSLEDLKGFFI